MKEDLLKKIFENKNLKKLLVLLVILIGQILLFVINVEVISGNGIQGVSAMVAWLLCSEYAFATVAVLALLLMGCQGLSGNLFFGYVLLEIVTVLLGITNNLLNKYRNKYLTVSDLKIWKEAASLRLNIPRNLFVSVGICILLGVLFGACLFKMRKKGSPILGGASKGARIAWRGGMIVVAMSALCALAKYYAKRDEFERNHGLLQHEDVGGVMWLLESTCVTDSAQLEMGVLPESAFDAVYQKYRNACQQETVTTESRPNIIVIMSEAFWDVDNFGNLLTFSEDPMEQFRKIQEESMSGQLAVNISGGSTIVSEMEFLTGVNSLGKMLGRAYTFGKQESFVSYLKELGYYVMGFHPFVANFWSREDIYQNLEMDEFYDMTRFENPEYYRGYISDFALTNEIISQFERAKRADGTRPVFCFAVSIQNHVAKLDPCIWTSEDTYEQRIDVAYPYGEVEGELARQTVEYVNGIAVSVAALQELLAYFRNYEEETIIVFFGDHEASMVTELADFYHVDEIENAHYTPYVIWNNYGLGQKDYGDFNCAFLSSVLIDLLQMPRCKQYYQNMYMMMHYPINTIFDIVTADGVNLRELMLKDRENEEVRAYLTDMEDAEAIVENHVVKLRLGEMQTDMWRQEKQVEK